MNSEFDLAKTAHMASLVDYAKDAIVSKTLMKKDTGTVTLFAFDQGQGLSEHAAPFDALVQVVDGCLELTIGGAEVRVGGGEIVLMPANIPHALHAAEPSRMVLTMLRDKE